MVQIILLHNWNMLMVKSKFVGLLLGFILNLTRLNNQLIYLRGHFIYYNSIGLWCNLEALPVLMILNGKNQV